jgi:hypothetical protein
MSSFPSIRIEGGLLSPELLDQVIAADVPGQKPADFGLEPKRNLTDEITAQHRVGFSSEAGGVGYLREAYHGKPYATIHLCAEAFAEDKGARIPAANLQERLPQTLALAKQRTRTIYRADGAEIEAVKQSFRDFVALCERKEQETGEPVLIVASY